MSIPINTRIASELEYAGLYIWILKDPAQEKGYGFLVKRPNQILFISELDFGSSPLAENAGRVWADAYNQGAGK